MNHNHSSAATCPLCEFVPIEQKKLELLERKADDMSKLMEWDEYYEGAPAVKNVRKALSHWREVTKK